MSKLHLVNPTEAEIQGILNGNSSEWKGALSLEAYLRRESFLVNQTLTRDGGLTAWALVEDDSPTRSILASCETIRKKALVSRGGKIENVICHGVCSVFCPPDRRGKGYASKMIKELGERLQGWQTEREPCLFSVLYSDIGKQFYTANQWYPFPSSHVALPARTTPVQDTSLPQSKPLYAEDLAELCAVDERLITDRLANVPQGKQAVAITPDVDTLRWHHAREEFVAQELYGRKPEVKGAIVGTEPGKRVWCYWTRVFTTPNETKDNTLHILRLVIEDTAENDLEAATGGNASRLQDSPTARAIASLFAAAQLEASKWTMADTDIWNPTSTTLAAVRLLDGSAKVVHREKESIASLRWYGEEMGNPVEHVEWLCNEKYGWC